MTPHHLYVGTIGEGVFRSLDHGKSFRRAADGMFVECDVRVMIVHPTKPNILYLGSEDGVFVSHDGASNWYRLPIDLDGLAVWSLCLLPESDRLIIGTCPARLFVWDGSENRSFEAAARIQQGCPRIRHTRVTCIIHDPQDANRLWAGVEIDGIYTSEDRGRSWQPINAQLTSQDVHALATVNGRLLATTNRDLNRSEDGGKTWRAANIDAVLPWNYTRGMKQLAGQPQRLLLGGGDGPPGFVGSVALSRDGGVSWQEAYIVDRTNSTVWTFAVHPADANLVYAASVSGQLLRSLDGGETWEKLEREFGEIRALGWAPVAPV